MVIKNKVSVFSNEYNENPYQFFSYFRNEQPVHFEESINAYFVSNYEDVQAVLGNDQLFTTKSLAKRAQPVMRDRVLAQMNGKEHKAKKSMILKGITGERLEEIVPLFEENAKEILNPYLKKGKIDLVNDFGKFFAVQSTIEMLGLDKKDQNKIAEWHQGIASFITSFNQSKEEQEYSFWCSEQLEKYLLPIIEERKNSRNLDLISLLHRSETTDTKMTSQEILALTLNILLAATEPVDKTLALLFYHLLENPDQFANVEKDRKLLKNAIRETLRYKSPVQFIPRQLSDNTEIRNIPLPKDALIICMIGAANRDPEFFTEPDRFNIYRELNHQKVFSTHSQNLSFGYGTHTCVGASLSLIQLELVANIILDKLKNLEYGKNFVYAERGLYTRGPKSLELEFRAS